MKSTGSCSHPYLARSSAAFCTASARFSSRTCSSIFSVRKKLGIPSICVRTMSSNRATTSSSSTGSSSMLLRPTENSLEATTKLTSEPRVLQCVSTACTHDLCRRYLPFWPPSFFSPTQVFPCRCAVAVAGHQRIPHRPSPTKNNHLLRLAVCSYTATHSAEATTAATSALPASGVALMPLPRSANTT